ncbi:hypothetical protein IC611_08660 [Proteus mirabilis]
MLRKGDTQFKSLIDETIANAQKSGAAENRSIVGLMPQFHRKPQFRIHYLG